MRRIEILISDLERKIKLDDKHGALFALEALRKEITEVLKKYPNPPKRPKK